MDIGDRIKSRRIELGLTQDQLGKRIGWPDSRIGIYERGENKPGRKAIAKLAEALEVSVEYLVKGQEATAHE